MLSLRFIVKNLCLIALWLALSLAQLSAFPVATQAAIVDGKVDFTFKSGAGFNDKVAATVLLPDGKILVGGRFTTYNETSRAYVARLNSDGTLDTTFNANPSFAGLTTDVHSLAIQSDGKILVGGSFSYNLYNQGLFRLNSDGSLDSSFNAQFRDGVRKTVYSLVVQPDGKILAGGNFFLYDWATETITGPWRGITRFNPDGSPDDTFKPAPGVAGMTGSQVRTIALQADGKILIGGEFDTYDGVIRNGLARLNNDGTLDTTLTHNLDSVFTSIYAIQLQSNGKILVGGYTTQNGSKYILRLNSDGSQDSSFIHPDTQEVYGKVFSMALQSDGKILVGMEGKPHVINTDIPEYYATRRILRLNPDGSLDSSFRTITGTGANATIYSIILQNDGKIVIGGIFNDYNQLARNRLARLNADGSLDTTFGLGTTGTEGQVKLIVPQNDGKILVAGIFRSYSGLHQNSLARLNSDGTPDTTFRTNQGWATNILATQADGKILVGRKANVSNPQRGSLERLNVDGSEDTTFTPDASFYESNHTIGGLISLADGKILVAEYFDAHHDINFKRFRVIRLNSNGTIDNSFNSAGSGIDGKVYTMLLQSDGKILIGGDFSTYNGITTNKLARLNADGSLDTSFVMSYDLSNAEVIGFKLQNNGKIVANLRYLAPPDPPSKLIRLQPDGQLDSSFTFGSLVWNPNMGLLGTINDLAVQKDGKILFTGYFTRYNNVTQRYLIRLNVDGSRDSSFDIGSGPENVFKPFAMALQKDGRILVGGSFNAFNGVTIGSLVRLSLGTQHLLVTLATDDNTGTQEGSLSAILAQATSGTIVRFNLPEAAANEIIFSGTPNLQLKEGVALDGGVSGVVLNGNGVQTDGLKLAGNNQLTNLTIKGFAGKEIVSSSNGTGQNNFDRVRIAS